MKLRSPRVCCGVLWSIVLMTGVCACAGKALVGDDQSALTARAKTYWQHRVKKAFAECYLMEAPEVREGITLTNYVMGLSGGIIWIAASPKSVYIDGDSGTVQIEMTYAMFGIYSPKGGITRIVPDYWKRVEGVWYHIYQPPKKSP